MWLFWALLSNGELYVHFKPSSEVRNHLILAEIRMSNPSCNPKFQTWFNSHLLPALIWSHNRWPVEAGSRVCVPPSLLSWLATYWDWLLWSGEHGETLKDRGVFSPWIGIVIRWHLAFLADVESFLFVSWALLWVHQLHPCWDPWLRILWLRALFSKCCWLISPQQAPRFLVAKSQQILAVGVQVPFPNGPLGKDVKWFEASSPSSVMYIWFMGETSHHWRLFLLAWCQWDECSPLWGKVRQGSQHYLLLFLKNKKKNKTAFRKLLFIFLWTLLYYPSELKAPVWMAKKLWNWFLAICFENWNSVFVPRFGMQLLLYLVAIAEPSVLTLLWSDERHGSLTTIGNLLNIHPPSLLSDWQIPNYFCRNPCLEAAKYSREGDPILGPGVNPEQSNPICWPVICLCFKIKPSQRCKRKLAEMISESFHKKRSTR